MILAKLTTAEYDLIARAFAVVSAHLSDHHEFVRGVVKLLHSLETAKVLPEGEDAFGLIADVRRLHRELEIEAGTYNPADFIPDEEFECNLAQLRALSLLIDHAAKKLPPTTPPGVYDAWDNPTPSTPNSR